MESRPATTSSKAKTSRIVPSALTGRPLNEDELGAYDVLPSDLARRARVHLISWLPSDYQGITLGRHIFLTIEDSGSGENPLLAHELVHVRQWHELGVVGFSLSYLTDFARGLRDSRNWKKAYRQIDAEVEARLATDEWIRRRLQFGQAPEPPSPPDGGV